MTFMWHKLIQTDGEIAPMVARLALGITIFPHGAQKLLGWFDGGGFSGTMGFLTSQGFPAALAFLASVAEFFGRISPTFVRLARVL